MFEKHILIFNKLSLFYEKLGDEIRSTAYHNLAKKLELNDLEGITKKSHQKIEEIDKRGTLKILTDIEKDKKLMSRIRLTNIMGVGPKTAEALVKKGIDNFSEFKKSKNLTKLQLLGVKYHNKISFPSANVFSRIIKILKNQEDKLLKIEIAGSYRTGNKTPGDIDLILCSKKGDITETIEKLSESKILVDYLKSGKNDILGVIRINNKFYRIDIKCVIPKYFYSYLLYFGSGKYFSKYIRSVAKDKGYKLNQYGLTNISSGNIKTFRSEKAIFDFLKLRYYTPEERVKYF